MARMPIFDKLVIIMGVTIELRANPIKPDSKHYYEPIKLPFNFARRCSMCEAHAILLAQCVLSVYDHILTQRFTECVEIFESVS